MKAKKSGAVCLFIGALLIVVFAVGLIFERNPAMLVSRYRYNLALEHFCAFCAAWWLPAGIVGFPLFLVTLIICLAREKKDRDRES